MITVALFFGTVGTILMFVGEPITWKMISTIVIKLIGAVLFIAAFVTLRETFGLHRR